MTGYKQIPKSCVVFKCRFKNSKLMKTAWCGRVVRTDYHRVCWEKPILVHPQTTHSLSASCVCCEFCLTISTYLIGSVCFVSPPSHRGSLNALSFQVASVTVEYMSWSASEKVGQIKARGGWPTTPTSHHRPLLNCDHHHMFPCPFFQAVLSSLCRCLLDVLTVFVFCLNLVTESLFLPKKQQL